MNPSSHDRIAHLTDELERVRRELAQLQQASAGPRPSGWLRPGQLMTAPMLLLGTWGTRDAKRSGARGIVRAGPYYRCSSTAQAVPLIGVARLPDCIMGRDKQ